MRPTRPLVGLILLLLVPSAAHAAEVLLADDYTGLSLGLFSGGVVGAMTEYHYLPAAAPRGTGSSRISAATARSAPGA
jgi:hypothetical protein